MNRSDYMYFLVSGTRKNIKDFKEKIVDKYEDDSIFIKDEDVNTFYLMIHKGAEPFSRLTDIIQESDVKIINKNLSRVDFTCMKLYPYHEKEEDFELE